MFSIMSFNFYKILILMKILYILKLFKVKILFIIKLYELLKYKMYNLI